MVAIERTFDNEAVVASLWNGRLHVCRESIPVVFATVVEDDDGEDEVVGLFERVQDEKKDEGRQVYLEAADEQG